MRFTMVILGLGTVVVLALLARALGGDTAGLIAAGIAALDPNLWMNDGLIMSESLCILVVSAILLVTYRVLRGRIAAVDPRARRAVRTPRTRAGGTRGVHGGAGRPRGVDRRDEA